MDPERLRTVLQVAGITVAVITGLLVLAAIMWGITTFAKLLWQRLTGFTLTATIAGIVTFAAGWIYHSGITMWTGGVLAGVLLGLLWFAYKDATGWS